jgi:hypothetical protein
VFFLLIKNIKEKLNTNKARITRTDKGNTTVIIYHNDYNQKVNDFISTGQFDMMTKDPTNSYQKFLRICLYECKLTINEYHKSRMINLNPTASNIRGPIKIHKSNQPIRPVVNWKNVPAGTMNIKIINFH